MTRYDAGIQGEKMAEEALQAKGMTIVERRYRAEDGEIDLIARDGDMLVFVEVKYRPKAAAGQGLLAVTPAKQRRIMHAAMRYLVAHDCMQMQVRFDVLEITRDGLCHVPNAFFVK